ncbi:MAG: response regulator [Beutenbergiaceae bacterium]
MVRILIVDDEKLVRTALKLVLDPGHGIEVVAEAASGVEAVTAVREHGPDVVLMDIRMPGGDGISAVRSIREAGLPCRIIMLTAFDTDEFLVDAFAAGADGFLLKSEDPDVIERAILEPTDGASTLSAPVLQRLVGLASRPRAQAGIPEAITEREWDVAELVAQGLSNAEIGQQLFLTPATVKTHLNHLFTKFGFDNRVQLAVRVFQHKHDLEPR